MKPLKIFTVVALSIIALTACNNDDNGKYKPRADIKLTQEQKLIAENGNEFAINAFKAINSNDSNVLISPYGMQLTLAMLANGAKGETLSEITNVMHFGTATAAELNAYFKTLSQALVNADDRASINLLSAFWYANSISVKPDFKTVLNSYYGATATSLDFSKQEALSSINNWASNATGGKINKLFSNLDSRTKACMANALTFHGVWSETMYALKSKIKFTNNKNEIEECEMFGGSNVEVNIANGDDADMLELDYGNGSFVMDVIMPKDATKINTYVAELSMQKINGLIAGLNKCKVALKMPRFETKYNDDLIGLLKTIGIKKIFGNGDLSGVADEAMQVTQYVQQLYVNVDKEGTKITVSTGSSLGPTDILYDKCTIDSPFVYMIRERSTGVILAIGKVQTMAGMQ